MATIISTKTSGVGGLEVTGDATGILQLASNNGTTAVTIDASQNVGIGTASPTGKLEVAGSLGNFYVENNGARLFFTRNSANYIRASGAAGELAFETGGATERMRIDSGGNVGIGINSFGTIAPLTVATASVNPNYGQITAYSITSGDVARAGMSVVKYDNNTTTSQILFKFLINQGANGSGQINSNGANACAFGTYSDARLKENITPLESELDKIVALKPCEFDFIKSEGGGHQIGFIAQEMQNIYPDAVGERDDGMLTISGWDKTTARLVKAIQELKTIIDTQAERIAVLENKQ